MEVLELSSWAMISCHFSNIFKSHRIKKKTCRFQVDKAIIHFSPLHHKHNKCVMLNTERNIYSLLIFAITYSKGDNVMQYKLSAIYKGMLSTQIHEVGWFQSHLKDHSMAISSVRVGTDLRGYWTVAFNSKIWKIDDP